MKLNQPGDSGPISFVREFNVKKYGATGDAKHVTDGVFNSTTTVTSATGYFTSADVGKEIWGVQAGTTLLSRRTIATYVDANTITVSGAAPGNWTGVRLVWGTDDTAAIQAAAVAADAVFPKGVVYVPRGGYIFDDVLFPQVYGSGTQTYSVIGDGRANTIFYPAPDHTKTNNLVFNRSVNAEGCTFSGFTINGNNVELNGVTVAHAPSYSRWVDVKIENFYLWSASMLYVYSGVSVDRCHFEACNYNGVVIAGSGFFKDCYNGNHGYIGLQLTSGASSAYWNAGIADECSGPTFAIEGGGKLNIINALVYAGAGQTACLVDNGTLRATQSEFIPFGSNNNVTGLDVNASGLAYLQGCKLVGNGTGYGLDNLGTVYDGGNNTANSKTGAGTIDATLAL